MRKSRQTAGEATDPSQCRAGRRQAQERGRLNDAGIWCDLVIPLSAGIRRFVVRFRDVASSGISEFVNRSRGENFGRRRWREGFERRREVAWEKESGRRKVSLRDL